MSVVCPNSGKKLPDGSELLHREQVLDREIVERVAASTGLAPGEAARVVDDVVAWYRESVEAYVIRRHGELRLRGQHNPEIFRALAAELAERVVAAPSLTERQLRRIVYG